jgi:hypothetical protein
VTEDRGSWLGARGSGERDTRMTATYVQVMVLEAVIVVALWAFGRLFP